MAIYRDRSATCWATVDDVEACILEAPCDAFADGDGDVLMMIPACERAVTNFDDDCGFGTSGACPAQSSAGVKFQDGGFLETDCEIFTACEGTNYGLDCNLIDGEYNCNCRLNGRLERSFSTETGCGFPDQAESGAGLDYIEFRCGYDVSGNRDERDCDAPDFAQGEDASFAACKIATSCVDGDYELDCTTVDDGVLCTCTVDGVEFRQRLLDSYGCSGAAGFGEDPDDEFTDLLLVLNGICGF
jgi:hypothetical protein